jgi:hypothetical protein
MINAAPIITVLWTRTRTPSGAWRCEHRNGSLIYVGRDAGEAEIQRRLAEAEATIARLTRKRISK